MKKRILLLVAILVVLTLTLTLASCTLEGFEIPGLEIPGLTDKNDKPDDKEDPDSPDDPVTPEEPEEPEEPVEPETPETPERQIRVAFYYEAFGDTNPFIEITVSSKTGFTDADMKTLQDAIDDEFGFSFDGFYTDRAYTNEFDFKKLVPGKIGIPVYCMRPKNTPKAGDNITWAYNETTKVISFTGSGEMYNYRAKDYTPWYSQRLFATKIEIGEGITSLSDYAFTDFAKLEGEIVLPSTLESIGRNAFQKTKVSRVEFPSTLKFIGERAFSDCKNITHISFNDGLESIGKDAFTACTGLETILLTESVTKIGSSCFYECENLSSVYYKGTKEQYDATDAGFRNLELVRLSQTWFISDTKPAAPGPYWHFVDDEITQWSYAIWYIDKNNDNVAIDINDKKADKDLYPTTLLVDFVDIDAGFTQANVDYMNNIVYHGYKFAGWHLRDENGDDATAFYNIVVGNKITSDIKLISDRGNICGDNLKWSISSNILTISKLDSTKPSGDMWDFETVNDAPWAKRNIVKVVIDDGVTHIGQYAFCNIHSTTTRYANFVSLDIPKCVTSVHANAFSGNNDLLYIFYAGNETELYGNAGDPDDPSDDVAPLVEGLASVSLTQNGFVYANATGLDFTTLTDGAYWADINTGNPSSNDGLPKGRITWVYDSTAKSLILGGINSSDLGILVNYANEEQRPWHHYRDNVENVVILDNVYIVGHLTVANLTNVKAIKMSTIAPFNYRLSHTAFIGTKYYQDMYTNVGYVTISQHLIAVNPTGPAIVGGVFAIPHTKISNTMENTLSIAMHAFDGCSAITKLIIPYDIGEDFAVTSFTGLTSLESIFFLGNETDWESYVDGTNASQEILKDATVKYFSATYPTAPGEGLAVTDYWYFDNGVPTAWVVKQS